VSESDTDGERSQVLTRLLDEIERSEEEHKEAARRPALRTNPLPRPFAHD
jgi:hypothetical protein